MEVSSSGSSNRTLASHAMLDLTSKRLSGPVIRLHPDDNVVVARASIAAGAAVPSEAITARDQIPAGYKIATADLRAGEPIRKYNTVIGFAGADIPAGALVHGHN